MNSLNLPLIEELYGQPLAVVPQSPPSNVKTWHILAGLVITGFAVYGAYACYQKYIKAPQVIQPESN